MESKLGTFAFEALAVNLDNEGLVVLLLDPKKPHLIPRGGDVSLVVDEAQAYICTPSDLVLRLNLWGQEVLVVPLVLLETVAS